MIAYDVTFQYWSSISLLKKSGEHPLVFLRRHASGDWGELSEEDRIENESSLVHGGILMHKHFCDTEGHDWECSSEDCACLCGLPMEGHDHSDRPVELPPCPEHMPEAERRGQEAMSAEEDALAIQKGLGHEANLPHCECGCADILFGATVGFCQSRASTT
jgi:hypothetical protein